MVVVEVGLVMTLPHPLSSLSSLSLLPFSPSAVVGSSSRPRPSCRSPPSYRSTPATHGSPCRERPRHPHPRLLRCVHGRGKRDWTHPFPLER